jgi:hypothetical protein
VDRACIWCGADFVAEGRRRLCSEKCQKARLSWQGKQRWRVLTKQEHDRWLEQRRQWRRDNPEKVQAARARQAITRKEFKRLAALGQMVEQFNRATEAEDAIGNRDSDSAIVTQGRKEDAANVARNLVGAGEAK